MDTICNGQRLHEAGYMRKLGERCLPLEHDLCCVGELEWHQYVHTEVKHRQDDLHGIGIPSSAKAVQLRGIHWLLSGWKRRLTELTQWRSSVGVGYPSPLNT